MARCTRHEWGVAIAAGLALVLVLSGAATPAYPGTAEKPTKAGKPALKPGPDDIVPPVLLARSQRTPYYPAAARAARINGAVVVELTVNVEGKVGESAVVDCTHGNVGFEESALDAVKRWKFRPALRRGEPVEYTARYRLFFGRNAAALYGAYATRTAMGRTPTVDTPTGRRDSGSSSRPNARATTPSRR